MTEDTRRTIGSIILGVTILVLLIQIAGMAGVIPKYLPTREVTIVAMVLVVLARGLRRKRTV
jgi:hypothetical protein